MRQTVHMSVGAQVQRGQGTYVALLLPDRDIFLRHARDMERCHLCGDDVLFRQRIGWRVYNCRSGRAALLRLVLLQCVFCVCHNSDDAAFNVRSREKESSGGSAAAVEGNHGLASGVGPAMGQARKSAAHLTSAYLRKSRLLILPQKEKKSATFFSGVLGAKPLTQMALTGTLADNDVSTCRSHCV